MPRKKQDKKPVKKPVKKPIKKPKKKKKAGRPTVWTEKNRQAIYKFLRTGATYTRACLMANISRASFNEWKKQGMNDREDRKITEFTDFLDKVEQAKAYYITSLHNVINKTAYGDASWALKMLQKKAREEFGEDIEKIMIENRVSGGTNNTNTNVNINSDEKLEEAIDILATVRGLKKEGEDKEVPVPETE